MSDMNIGEAVQALREGKRVARAGWNGKNMFLAYVAGTEYQLQKSTIAEKRLVGYNQSDWVGMATADGKFVPWLCSQTDLLARDYFIVGD